MTKFKQKPLEENPFRPGFGEEPPTLAGRGHEQEILGVRVRGLAKSGSRQAFAVYGPRGMGKTVLLHWLKGECQRHTKDSGDGRELSVIEESAPKMLATQDSLLNALSRDQRVGKQFETSIKGGVPGFAQGEAKQTDVYVDRRWADLESTLIAACRQTPIVLLLDEAHAVNKVNSQVYQQFLNIVQDVVKDAPFLLVLAGTPDLPDALSAVNATFVDRAEELGIGLLDTSEAAKAIGEPLAADGICIDADALLFAAEDAQCYPYFLQWWGKFLWDDAMAGGKERISLQEAETVGDKVQEKKIDYYKKRYQEVCEDILLQSSAWAVASQFEGVDGLKQHQLRAAVREALAQHLPPNEVDEHANKHFATLRHRGFVWCKPGEDIIRPGIPSLMDYTRAKMRDEQSMSAR